MTLQEHVMRVANGMPQGGGYNWPTNDGSGGCFKTIIHNKATILRAGKGTYCCGVTFEVFWRAWEGYAVDAGLPLMRGITASQARQAQRDWFCVTGRRGAQKALVDLGLGVVVQPSESKMGDFVQFWRPNGSGHSAIVLSIAKGKMAYLSTQRSTNGYGSNVETQPAEIYVVRPVG